MLYLVHAGPGHLSVAPLSKLNPHQHRTVNTTRVVSELGVISHFGLIGIPNYLHTQ